MRPHEALAGKVPGDVYKVAERKRPVSIEYVYNTHLVVRRVYPSGAVNFRGEEVSVGTVFAGHHIGFEVVDAMHVRGWFRSVDLGLIETTPQVDDACFQEKPPKSRSRAASRIPKRNVPPPAGAAAAIGKAARGPSSRSSPGDEVAC